MQEFKVGEDEYDLTDSDARFSLECELLNKDQDKISFALEQLTQAKDYIKKSLENMWNTNAEMTCRDRSIIDGIYNKLDEQLEELTHQHEDKGE